MPWWTCFNCASRTTPTNPNDVIVLDYAHHSLHDVPANVFQYERTLEELYLSSNRITELPRQLFLCHGLKVLDISDNDLSSIPTALSSLINVRKINLARNSLTRLTDSIVACKALTHLDLSINSLEKLPDAITNLITLEELYLNDTFLEFLPSNFGRLINLRILELRDNNLMTLPKSMNRLTALKRLDIGNNEFTELPEVIGSLIALNELWCDGNRIRHFNCNVSNLKELIHFDASNNLIQFLPTEIGSWQRCQELCISANEIEELPFSIGMMKSLIALKIDENQLQELPDSICEMESLEELMISHNDLFKLPSTIGLLRRLRFLTADENLLRSLPNEICSCSSLTILSVRGNKLTKMPVDIGRLTQLRVLNIVNNFLSNLPVTILNLTQLSALWISDNQSQPLMPLQKEFHKETQSFYLTCYLLPQMYTSNSTPTPTHTQSMATASSTAADSTYDYYPPAPRPQLSSASSVCDNSQQNAHITALENLSLSAIAKRKRNICFASDPPQEIAPNLRLMRSPTPYPKELRMMQAKFAANKSMQQHHQQQNHQYQQQQQQQQQQLQHHQMCVPIENGTNNLDQQSCAPKLLNTMNMPNTNELEQINHRLTPTGVVGLPTQQQQQQSIQSQLNQTHQNFELNNGSHTTNGYNDPHRLQAAPMSHAKITNDVVQYNSFNMDATQAANPHAITNETVEYISNGTNEFHIQHQLFNQQTQHQPYRSPSSLAFSETNSMNVENGLKATMDSDIQLHDTIQSNSPMEFEANHNNTHHHIDTVDAQQHPPPYHIAKAFTKKSKQDLLIYDIYRNNYHTQEQQEYLPSKVQQHTNNLIETQLPNDRCMDNSLSTYETSETNSTVSNPMTTVDSDNNDIIVNHSRNNSLIRATKTPWFFGEHKNPTVMQLSVPKLTSDIGFKIVKHSNQGIFVSDVDKQSSAHGKLSVKDKILDVDGVDFTKISLVDAETVLSNAGSIINIMISRDK